MNPIIPIFTMAATLAVFGQDTAPAADNDSQTVPTAPAHPPTTETPAESEIEAQEKAQAKFDKARKHYAELKQEADAQAAQAAQAAVAELATPRYADRVQNIVRRSSGNPNRALLIRTTEVDPKDQANFEEDLTVMSHLLGKAVKDNLGSGFDRKAMGIDVAFAPTTAPIRSLYLDGYGAVFIVSVTFPVLPPPGTSETAKEKPGPDSTWDEAKREVLGQQIDGKPVTTQGEQFNEEKTDKLKTSLLEALKNATHLRGLKPQDAITVCVFGPGLPVQQSKSRVKAKQLAEIDATPDGSPRPAKTLSMTKVAPASSGTTMTLKTQKSDVDEFAGGKLTLEGFREKVKFTSYAGGVMGGTATLNLF